MRATEQGATKLWACSKCGVVTLREGKIRSEPARLLLYLCAPTDVKRRIDEARRAQREQ